MKLRKLIYLLFCAVISIAAFDATETYAAQKKSKARTSQSSGKSKSRKNPDRHRDTRNQKVEEIPLSIKRHHVQKPASQKNIQNEEDAM